MSMSNPVRIVIRSTPSSVIATKCWADKPRVAFDKPFVDTGVQGKNFDVAPDGKRIIALRPVETPEAQEAQNHVVFLLNFADELRRKAPLK